MVFIASLFKPTAPPTPPAPSPAPPPRISLQPYATSLLQVVRAALTSTRPPLRILACGVLASPILAELEVDLLPLDPFVEALRLAEDDEATVRAAAMRTMGLLVKSSLFDSVSCSLLSFSRRQLTFDFAEAGVAQYHLRKGLSSVRGGGPCEVSGKLVAR